MLLRKLSLGLLLLVAVPAILAGCGDGGSKIEPESKSGSPILNKDKAPKPPTTP